MTEPRIGGIVLAAGRGRRFGADKRLARLADGRTLLERAVERLLPAVDELLVVIGAEDDEARFSRLCPQARLLRASRSADGMGASLADAILTCDAWDGALVALCDKPFVQTQTALQVRAMLNQGHALVVPLFDGERGHPVGFLREHFRALAALQGDSGARRLIDAAADRCLFLATDDPGVVRDVDTPEQLVVQHGGHEG